MSSEGAHLRDQVLAMDAVPLIIETVDKMDESELISVGSWALTNLCRGTPKPEYFAIALALCPIARMVISMNSTDVLMNCCWALTNFSD